MIRKTLRRGKVLEVLEVLGMLRQTARRKWWPNQGQRSTLIILNKERGPSDVIQRMERLCLLLLFDKSLVTINI